VLITLNSPPLKAGAQVIKRNLKRIGLDVEVEALPGNIYFPRIAENRDDWDIAWAVWAPDHFDPYAYLNALFDPRFTASNLGSFNEPRYSTALRQANTKSGQARDRAYARLDAQLARYAVPTVAIQFTSEPTFVSKRVDKRCLGQRATIDLAVVCLKR
jgi:ABC-type transport system substrate-binding protein